MWFCKDIAINDADDFRTLDLLVSLFIGKTQYIFYLIENKVVIIYLDNNR